VVAADPRSNLVPEDNEHDPVALVANRLHRFPIIVYSVGQYELLFVKHNATLHRGEARSVVTTDGQSSAEILISIAEGVNIQASQADEAG
jgi:hypothetical protein